MLATIPPFAMWAWVRVAGLGSYLFRSLNSGRKLRYGAGCLKQFGQLPSKPFLKTLPRLSESGHQFLKPVDRNRWAGNMVTVPGVVHRIIGVAIAPSETVAVAGLLRPHAGKVVRIRQFHAIHSTRAVF